MTPTLRVIDAIARHFSTSRHCILGRDRHKSIALARKVAMYCARSFVLPQPSYPELGRSFGNRDHTTVMSAVGKIEKGKADPWIADAIEVGRRAAVIAVALPPVDATDFLVDYQVRLEAAE